MKSLMVARIDNDIYINLLQKDHDNFMVEHNNIVIDGYKARPVIGARRIEKRFVSKFTAIQYYTTVVTEVLEAIE